MGAPKQTIVFTSNHATADKKSLSQLVGSFARGVSSDFLATNQATVGKAIKFGTGAVLVAPRVAEYYETYTPLKWAMKGFGALPGEFTKSGAIHVFPNTTTVQRAVAIARASAVSFALVTAAYEGGVLVGSIINQTLPEKVQDAIGGTLNEIINEGGWRDLYKHPFGIGL
jgi:hypothetical protein